MKWFLGILGILLLLLWIPLYSSFEYKEEEVSAWVRWLFIKKQVLPVPDKPPEEEKAKKEKKARKKKKPKAEKKAKKKLTPSEMASTGFLILKSSARLIQRLLRSIHVDKLVFYWAVTGEDAAEAAISSGRYNGVVYTTYAAAQHLITIGPADIRITPDYLGEKDRHYVSGEVMVRPGMVLVMTLTAGTIFLWKLLQQRLARKPSPQEKAPPKPADETTINPTNIKQAV